MENNKFVLVGMQPRAAQPSLEKRRRRDRRPWVSILLLGIILLGCLCCELFIPKDPAYMDLMNYDRPPDGEFLFGTDSLGRDVFSMIWYGGRISLLVGLLATAISTLVALVYGSVSGLGPRWLDGILMRFVELFLSVPNLLIVILLQAILGKATVLSLSLVIGLSSWSSMAKLVRTEVRQMKNSDYVLASRAMGGGFFHILWKHLTPNLVSSMMFLVVMNITGAMVAESTLSFFGMGLPLEIVSWGSMLSLAQQAMLSGSWWMVLIPGGFLVVTLLCITALANHLRKSVNRRHSNL